MNSKEKIDYVINRFDFKKVQKVMKCLKWKYHDGMPDIDNLKEVALWTLKKVSKAKEVKNSWLIGTIETGGFRASKIRYKEGNLKPEIIYKLEFIVTSYDSLIC
jgi:hypothetical protein